jgi:hypothetical protein
MEDNEIEQVYTKDDVISELFLTIDGWKEICNGYKKQLDKCINLRNKWLAVVYILVVICIVQSIVIILNK